MPKNCDNCKYDLFRLCGEEDKTPCDDCYNGNPPTKWEPGENYEPKTNADRIRAMSDEELVKYFWDIGAWESFDDRKFCDNNCNAEHNCDLCRLEWLQQPAEGE